MNVKTFQAINHLAGNHPILDAIMIFVTQNALFIFAFILLFMWFFGNEKYKYTVVYAALTGALSLFINFLIGQIYFEPRPFVTHHVNMLISHAADASFPSDHTTGAFSLAFAILLRHRKIGFMTVLIAALTGFSRIYVGHHYPLDVLGSILVALSVSLIVFKASRLLRSIPNVIINMYNKIFGVPKNKRFEQKNMGNFK
ncbi:undecaprenyl-diphosphatase [Pseudoneobacillus sp. C159]